MSTAQPGADNEPVRRPTWHDRAPGLVTAAILVVLLTFLTIGILTMTVPSGAEPPGPKVFPTIVAVLTGVLLVMQLVALSRPAVRTMKADPDPGQDTDDAPEARAPGTHDPDDVNSRALVGAMGSFLVFSLLLQPVGWLISAALLFTGVAWSIGARNLPTVLGAGLAISSVVQLAFGGGLGLALPAGILEGVF
ncbi:MAG: tripartite tricarboxylate transporter TctB family protein [Ornithinimicrobium sp.]